MGDHSVRRHRGWSVGLTAVIALAAASVASAATTIADRPALRAELDGRPIALGDVSRYHCHDRAYPLIRCFRMPSERDADEGVADATATPATDGGGTGAITAAASAYVRWYLDANYGGPSFDAYIDYRDLGSVGWNDKISSFETFGGAHPRWWPDVGFTGSSWDWGTTSVPYVGDAANDRFSSMRLL